MTMQQINEKATAIAAELVNAGLTKQDAAKAYKALTAIENSKPFGGEVNYNHVATITAYRMVAQS